MLSSEERVKSKLDKKLERFAKRHPTPWYKPWDWVPPVLEKTTDAKGRTKVKVQEHGYHKRNHPVGTQIRQGERLYEVQKSGALKCLNKEPSKRDLHRENVR